MYACYYYNCYVIREGLKMGIIRLYLAYTEILLILFFYFVTVYPFQKKWNNSKNENSGSTYPKTAVFCFFLRRKSLSQNFKQHLFYYVVFLKKIIVD